MTDGSEQPRAFASDKAVLRDFLPYGKLEDIAKSKAAEYAAAPPFPHIILDDFFDPAILDAVLDEFPNPRDRNWTLHDTPEELKLQSSVENEIPLHTRHFLYALNSGYFLKFLEKLTGIRNLIADPHFHGGGLHQIVPGGKLAIHIDFNKHLELGLDRRLNLILYLNKNWKAEYGGDFELWNRDMTQMEKRVAPLFNRVLIFTLSGRSYHGHPDPLLCPDGMTRKSLALFYYTNGDGTDREGWSGRHSSLWHKRPGERFKTSAKHVARELTPPLLWRALAKFSG